MNTRPPRKPNAPVSFEAVKSIALALPGVEAATRYDGAPVLRARGCFMAGLTTHPSAEPETLVVRIPVEDRVGLLEDAPDTYYLTDYLQKHPVVLVRLSRIGQDALRELLTISWRSTLAKRRRPDDGGLMRARRVRPRSG